MTSSVAPTTQRIDVDNSVIFTPFKSWLISKNYSGSTIRNYLSDINAYFQFVENCKPTRPTSGSEVKNSDPFSSDTISSYLKTIRKDSSYSRYLSSLSKFFQFAQNQNLISTDPLKTALKHQKPSTDQILNQYSEYLNKKRFSPATIKNYLNDIRQFINWNQQQNSNLQNLTNQ